MLWNARARRCVAIAPMKNRASPDAAARPAARNPIKPSTRPAAPAPFKTARKGSHGRGTRTSAMLLSSHLGRIRSAIAAYTLAAAVTTVTRTYVLNIGSASILVMQASPLRRVYFQPCFHDAECDSEPVESSIGRSSNSGWRRGSARYSSGLLIDAKPDPPENSDRRPDTRPEERTKQPRAAVRLPRAPKEGGSLPGSGR